MTKISGLVYTDTKRYLCTHQTYLFSYFIYAIDLVNQWFMLMSLMNWYSRMSTTGTVEQTLTGIHSCYCRVLTNIKEPTLGFSCIIYLYPFCLHSKFWHINMMRSWSFTIHSITLFLGVPTHWVETNTVFRQLLQSSIFYFCFLFYSTACSLRSNVEFWIL